VRLLAQASAHAIPLGDETVQCVVTSPPYWGLRQYAGEQSFTWGGDPDCAHAWGERETLVVGRNDTDRETPGGRGGSFRGGPREAEGGAFCNCGAWRGALGLEPTPELYVEHMVDVFREVRRVLRPDGTLWLNLGDSYAGGGTIGRNDTGPADIARRAAAYGTGTGAGSAIGPQGTRPMAAGLKHKDLVGIPWRVAFALQSDGWYLRSDIIWAKPNPMPESVTDRPTKAHEYLFLLTKAPRYYYDAEAIREPAEYGYRDTVGGNMFARVGSAASAPEKTPGVITRGRSDVPSRNARTVWQIATQPYPGAHFATFPEKLVEPCILAGSGAGDIVLDPFNGSGTVGRVAIRHSRRYVGLDISREYLHEQATQRTTDIQLAMGAG
jgi:DNA modification methylase